MREQAALQEERANEPERSRDSHVMHETANINFSMSDSPAESLTLSEVEAG